jgi:hypothetical protein
VSTKAERAKALLEKADELGCVATRKGNWTVFTPPLPIDMLMEATELGDELDKLVP